MARAYGQGQLSQVYPLTVTVPLYIAVWSAYFLGEQISLLGGLVMMLSFITFRIGLQEVHASSASALRQVSTVFGLGIGFFVFKEPFGLRRVLSTMSILAGAVLIKMG